MDPKLNNQETFQCQYCLVYVNKSSQQVHESNCQLFQKNQQGVLNNNKDNKPFSFIGIQKQSKDFLSNTNQVSFKQNPQIIPQLNNTGIQNIQKNQIPPFQKTLNQNVQFQDNSKNGNQQNQQQFNSIDFNTESSFLPIRLIPKELPNQNKETKNEQLPQQKLQQTPQIAQQNPFQRLILLPQQQKNPNAFQIKQEKGINPNIQKGQQGNFEANQNQQQNQEQFQIFRTQNLNDNGNVNQQQQIPPFLRTDIPKQIPIKFNPTPTQNNNIFLIKNIQQTQPQQTKPQQIQQQQQNIQLNQSQNLSPTFPLSFNFTQFQNNRQSNFNQTISNSQPIQGQPYIPLQFPAPQIPQNIQPPPFTSSIFPKFRQYLSNEDEDDDDDDDEIDNAEYGDLINIQNRGLPNFDVNKQYTDLDVNRMNQEQIYQYFSNLFINENHGYSEDQINEKICHNFSMKFDDNRIDICVICQESFTQETFTTDKQLPCSHLFHENCLIGWLKRSKSCPICKTGVEL